MQEKVYIVKREDSNYNLLKISLNNTKISTKIVGLVDGWLINQIYYLQIQRRIIENRRIKSKSFWKNLNHTIQNEMEIEKI